jgi:hypothetical protein
VLLLLLLLLQCRPKLHQLQCKLATSVQALQQQQLDRSCNSNSSIAAALQGALTMLSPGNMRD